MTPYRAESLTPVFTLRDHVTPTAMPGRRENYVVTQARWLALGGSDTCEIEVRETDPLLLAQLLERLMFGVSVAVGNVRWQGYIHEVRVPDGKGGEYGVTLEGVGNRIRAVWSSAAANGRTAFVDDLAAQTELGAVIEYEMQVNNADAASALNAVNMELAKRARPLPVYASSGAQYARLMCRGWWWYFGKEFYGRANTLYYGRDTRATGETGGSYPLYGSVNGGPGFTDMLAFAFDVAGLVPHYLDSLQVTVDVSGGWQAAEVLHLEIHSVGASVPLRGSATRLAQGSVAVLPQPYGWNDVPVRKLDGTRLLITPGETYYSVWWLTGQGSGPTAFLRCAELTGPVGTVLHEYPVYYYDIFENIYVQSDQQIPFYANGVLDHSTQIAEICTASQFVTTADAPVTTGLQTNPYRDGTQTADQVLTELSKSGTTNYRRLLYTVEDFYLHAYEEPADTATPLVLDGGQLYQGNQRYWGAPVGHWVRIKDAVLPRNRVVQPDYFLCERATYTEGRGWECEARDVESEWSIAAL